MADRQPAVGDKSPRQWWCPYPRRRRNARLFEHPHVREINRGRIRFPASEKEVEDRTASRCDADRTASKHGIDGRSRGNRPPALAASTVSDHAKAEVFIDREAIWLVEPGPRLADSHACSTPSGLSAWSGRTL